MRTTIDLPDETFRNLKAVAASQGITLKVLLRRAVDHELERTPPGERPFRVSFPLIDSSQPGVLKSLTREQLDELLT